MSILKPISIILLSTVFVACTSNEKETTEPTTVPTEKVELSHSQTILNESIKAHGGELYNTAEYSFVFRGNTYQFANDGSDYTYTKKTVKGDTTIFDVLNNGLFTRAINGEEIELTEKQIAGGTGAINSVIYFATLPYKLQDKAVNTKYVDSIVIKDKNYDVLEITFAQDGGGEDHDDEYYYWINKDTKKIDYFAYNYSVNEGGVRFRSAYNTRVVDGITFQDYVNYKAEVGTPLKDLPGLYEAGKLTELSKIDTENVVNLAK